MKAPALIAAAAQKLDTPGAPIVNEAMRRFGLEKGPAITVTLCALMDQGLTVEKALDFVFGAGTFRALADDVWEALQEQEAAA